jgi:hypothetical protein
MVEPPRGSNVTPCRNAFSRFPITAPDPLNASEYATHAHVIVTAPSAAMLIMNVLRLFFDRTSPA